MNRRLFACAASLALTAGAATAETINVPAYWMTVPNPVVVDISFAGTAERGYAGQITLDTVQLGQLPAWCLDIYDYLGMPADYVTGRLNVGGLDTPADRAIAALMAHGDALIAAGGSADVSAAIQIAIWDEEYAATVPGLTIAPESDAPAISVLAAGYLWDAASGTWTASGAVVTLSQGGNQTMGYVDAPEPAGALVFLTACLGLAVVRRRS
jgi:hypothetical protein